MRNERVYKKIKANFDSLSKPLDSLGSYEEIIARMGASLSDEKCQIQNSALLVFCSDNGIIEEGVSQSDESVTFNIARLLGLGNSSVCHMAKAAGVSVKAIDLGIKQRGELTGLDERYFIASGTKNFSKEPAMNFEQCQKAIEAGKALARECYDKGARCLLLGEMGIGNTTTSSAVIAAILHLEPEEICGRGSGLSDEGLKKKNAVIRQAIEDYDLYEASPSVVLQTVGGFDIAAMAGVILEAGQIGLPVILDGLITAAGALVAVGMDESVRDVVFFSHKGKEKGILKVADVFNQTPVIDASLALGEGTGAVIFYGSLMIAKALYDGNTTFEKAGIESYTRFI